jgi:hypothetical protein
MAGDGTFVLKFIRPGEQFIQAAPLWLDATQAPVGTSQTVALKAGEVKDGVDFQVKEERKKRRDVETNAAQRHGGCAVR